MRSILPRKEPTLRLSLEEHGSISINQKEEITELDLLREYGGVQLTLGHAPSIAEMAKMCKYHVSTYARRFGSWSKFRADMGNPVEQPLSRQQLIENYYSVKEQLGRVPTGAELGIYGSYSVRTYHKYFGGHRKFLEFLGERKSSTTKDVNGNATTVGIPPECAA